VRNLSLRDRKHLLWLLGLAALPLLLLVCLRTSVERREQDAVESSLKRGVPGGMKYPQLSKSTLDVRLIPLKTTIAPTQSRDYKGNSRTVLVLPIRIENRSNKFIKTEIEHEWFGGEWPVTDLHVYFSGGTGVVHPVFLVGEKGSAKPIVLRPGESIRLDLRMDWPGTGSSPATPLMSTRQPAQYPLRFVLLLGKQYLLSPKFWIGVEV
jgi:hypothetical protein